MRYACLLRGINVSGKRKISMQELCALCKSIGFDNVQSYLVSGNIILESDLPRDAVSQRLAKAICDEFSYEDVDVVVFDSDGLDRILSACP